MILGDFMLQAKITVVVKFSVIVVITKQWASISKSCQVSDSEPSFIQIRENIFYLSKECVIMQYQEAMYFISRELRKGRDSNQITQLQLWAT